MSLKSGVLPSIPYETKRVARAAFPKGCLCLRLRDTLGSIFSDDDFTELYPDCGQPAYAPWRLALVSILQFVDLSVLRGFPIAKPPRPFAVGSIGSTFLRWS